MLNSSAAILLLAFAGADVKVELNPPQPVFLTDRQFERALRLPGPSASWSNVNLRRIAHDVAEQSRISILLDRRVDPTAVQPVDVAGLPLFDTLYKVAQEHSATMCATNNVVIIGPADSLLKLRTLIQLRVDELFRPGSKISEGRKLEISKSTTLHYGDLQSPADLLDVIAKNYKLEIIGRELVPHDLWAGATFPSVDAVAALSLVLIQFDLTFEWGDGAYSATIVPIPKSVEIERRYKARAGTATSILETWKRELPELSAEVNGNEIVVRGTIEQHEAVHQLVRQANMPRSAQTNKTTKTTKPQFPPLSEQKFSLELRRVPAEALMKKLEEKGVVFQFDAAALTAAGIDLKTPISVNVKQVSADEFFHAVFDPLKVSFTISGVTVALKPQ